MAADAAGARSACSACGTVFSDHRARVNPVVQEDEFVCPNRGQVRFEPHEFGPDASITDSLAGPSDEDRVP